MKGHITKRKGVRGVSYRVRIELPRDADGKRRSKSFTYPTRREAERELARLLRELDTGQWADPTSLTFGEYLARWLQDAARQRLAAKSYERAASVVRMHLLPTLGSVPLAKVSPLHLQRLYGQLLADGMAPAGVRKVHGIAHSALGQAMRWRLLAANPADGAELPRVERHEVRALTESETARLLSAAQGSRLYAPVVVAVSTGLRRGELLGLRWGDVDLDGSALSVVQTLEETAGGVALKSPKTPRSRRRVTLPASAVSVLRAHRIAQDQERLRVGARWKGRDFVFAAVGGGPWTPSNFSRAFRAVLQKTAGESPEVPALSCRFHDLRHTHASQLLRQGVHPKVVSERLGHANVSITLDIYSHVLPGLQEEAARLTNEALTAIMTASQTADISTTVPKRSPSRPSHV